MKKLILGLVLATLTLPAMALTDAQKLKVVNALAVMSSNGIDPTILSTEIDWTQDKFQSTQADTFGNTIKAGFSSTGEFILHQGSAGFENLDNTVDKYGYTHNGVKFGKHKFTTVNLNGTIWMEGGGGSGNAEIVEGLFEDTYERYSTNLVAWEQSWGEGNIFLDDDDVISEFIQGKIGGAVREKANNLKPVIKAVGYQIAGANLGKVAHNVCKEQFVTVNVINACSNVGDKFTSVAQGVHSMYTPGGYIVYGAKWYLNTSTGLYYNNTYFTGYGASEGYFTAKGAASFVELNEIDSYNDSLDSIVDIADAFGELDILLNIEGSDITYGEVYR